MIWRSLDAVLGSMIAIIRRINPHEDLNHWAVVSLIVQCCTNSDQYWRGMSFNRILALKTV